MIRGNPARRHVTPPLSRPCGTCGEREGPAQREGEGQGPNVRRFHRWWVGVSRWVTKEKQSRRDRAGRPPKVARVSCLAGRQRRWGTRTKLEAMANAALHGCRVSFE